MVEDKSIPGQVGRAHSYYVLNARGLGSPVSVRVRV